MAATRKRVSRLLVAGFIVFSFIFIASLGLRPYPLSWIIKTIPIICLALWVLLNIKGKAGLLLGIGLICSGAGDILLELPVKGLFEAGMGAFILAHLFYIVLFIRHPGFSIIRVLLMATMAVSTLCFAYYLYPRLGSMMVPIYVYLCVILCMGVSACLGRDNHWLIILGAGLFILSDALIAYNMFATPISHSSFWVMSTYYGAQAMLTAGVARSKGVRRV